MAEVIRLSIGMLIGWFLGYLIIHIAIAILLKRSKKELELKPGNAELESQTKFYKIAFKWFPVVTVILILIMLLR